MLTPSGRFRSMRDEELAGILRIFGITKATHPQSLLAQYKVCLLQAKGFPCEYIFSWSSDGPYAEELAEALRVCQTLHVAVLPQGALKNAADEVNRFEDDCPKDVLLEKWYMLLSSLVYMNAHWGMAGDDLAVEAEMFLPRFADETVRAAIAALAGQRLCQDNE